MNVKVVIIVVFVVVLAVLGAPLVLGALNGNLGTSSTADAKSDAEWTDAKLAGTRWGAIHTEAIPEIIGTGTVTADVTITFNSGGTFSIKPDITFSPDTPPSIQGMAAKMIGQLKDGKWTLDYPKLTLSMPNPRGGEGESVVATISGDTISGPNLIRPGAEPLTLTRRY